MRPMTFPVRLLLGTLCVSFVLLVGFAVTHVQPTSTTPTTASSSGFVQPIAVKDLGVVADAYGSQWQGQALLDAITQNPNGTTYRVFGTSAIGERITLTADYMAGTLTRRHVDKTGKGTTETWQGDVLARVTSAAGGGTFNDTPRGKSFGTFEKI